MPYATVYDASAAGFDFRGLLPILACAVAVAAAAALTLRRGDRRRFVRWLVVGLAGTTVAVALTGVGIEYHHFRLDMADLEAGRAPFVEGIIEDHQQRHGGERFMVDAVPLHTRTSLGGYGMKNDVAGLTDGLPVRVHYSLRVRGRRRIVLRLAEARTAF